MRSPRHRSRRTSAPLHRRELSRWPTSPPRTSRPCAGPPARACSTASAPSKRVGATSRRPRCGCASRGWPARPSALIARPPRARWHWRCPIATPPSSSCGARPTSSPRPRPSSTSPTSWPSSWRRRASRPPQIAPTTSTSSRPRSRRTSRSARRSGSRWARDSIVGTYLHMQSGRGVNAVLVEMRGGTDELAHDVAVHVAFARPLVPPS